MRFDLAEDPAVIGIAARLGMDEFSVVGRLHRLWVWANQQLENGDAPSVTEKWIDRHTCTPGFTSALVAVGWLVLNDAGVTIPKFDRWNSKGAKQRILTSQRMKKMRDAPSVTKSSPQERTEENKKEDPPNPPKPGGGGAAEPKRRKPQRDATDAETDPRFIRFWAAYPKKAAKPDAARALAKIDPPEELLAAMLAALERQKRSEKWTKDRGEFIPHPATWLNGRRWEDGGEPELNGTPTVIKHNPLCDL